MKAPTPSEPSRQDSDSPDSSRFEPTLNATGFMARSLDPVSREFVNFAATTASGPALDIGAAYGVATHAALARGATVIASDIDIRHLEILESRTPDDDRSRLALLPGAFPDQLQLEASTIGTALAARVLHLFDGPQVERSAAALYRWLVPGGRVFVISAASRFLRFPELRRRFEERLKAGIPWPGFEPDVRELISGETDQLPEQVHYLSPKVLAHVFRQAGFRIEKCGFYQNPQQPLRNVGLRACKD